MMKRGVQGGESEGVPPDPDVKRAGGQEPPPESESLALLHELQVHQIELRMQNEELVRAHREAEEARRRYEDIFDFAPVGYFILDERGGIVEANLAALSLLGHKGRFLVGTPLFRFIAPESRRGFDAFFRRAMSREAREQCEVQLGGGVPARWAMLEGASFVEEGRAMCRVALVDITERKRAEEAIEKLNTDLAARAAELETANRELEAYGYTVSHDLRQPLNVIDSYCQLIEELYGERLGEEGRGYLAEVRNGTLRMDGMIGALLEFSRMARMDLRRETVDLSTMAEAVARELAEPGRRVRFRAAGGIRTDGDPSLLRVVLHNLIGNAWKYTAMREEAVIEFGATEIGGQPACFVRDNGPGFDAEDAEQLFTAFRRLSGAEEFEGFGIGLATVERIVRRHGGRVWAEGEPGKGATFYFTLPGVEVST